MHQDTCPTSVVNDVFPCAGLEQKASVQVVATVRRDDLAEARAFSRGLCLVASDPPFFGLYFAEHVSLISLLQRLKRPKEKLYAVTCSQNGGKVPTT